MAQQSYTQEQVQAWFDEARDAVFAAVEAAGLDPAVRNKLDASRYDGKPFAEGLRHYVADWAKESRKAQGSDAKATRGNERNAKDTDDDEGADVEGLTPADVADMSIDQFVKVQGKLMKALGGMGEKPVRESKPKPAPEKEAKRFTAAEVEKMSATAFARNYSTLAKQADELIPPDKGYRNPRYAEQSEFGGHLAALAAEDE